MNTMNSNKADTYKLVKPKKPPADAMFGIQPKDRTKLKCISYYVILQCITAFTAIATILKCLWDPEDGFFELDILTRIMYLYDTDACGKARSLRQFRDLYLNNDTHGLRIKPIRHEPVSLNVLTKLSGKTRTYVKVSIALHFFWISAALLMWMFVLVKDMKVFKIILKIFYYVTTIVIIFDFCMGIVYMAHIQQSLTKAMIIRYSGWGMVPRKVRRTHEFGGWVPLIASAIWLRGGIFLILNIYICRFVKKVIHKIRGKEVRSRISTFCNVPFPEAKYNQETDYNALYFRAGSYNKF